MRYIPLAVVMLVFVASAWLFSGETTVIITVVDEGRVPISGATVGMGWSKSIPHGQGWGLMPAGGVETITDSNGIARLQVGGVGTMDARHQDYYTDGMSRDEMRALMRNPVLALNRPEITIVLLKKLRPVPMYVRNVKTMGYLDVPLKDGTPCGFDLIKRAWVPPYGTGETSDWIISCQYNERGEYDWDKSMAISFSNPDDGIQLYSVPYSADRPCALRLPRVAIQGGYLAAMTWNDFVHAIQVRPDGPWQMQKSKSSATPDDNYIFRIRTKRNERGDITTAMYGKIHGPITNPQSRFYLNPDGTGSLEWDCVNNLFGALPETERVRPEP